MKNNVTNDIEEALGRQTLLPYKWRGLDLKQEPRPWPNESVIHRDMYNHRQYVTRNSQASAMFLPETINRIIDRSQRQQKRETLYDLLRRILSRTTTYFLGD